MRINKLVISSILTFLVLLLPVGVFALGQMTEPIAIEGAMRGNEYQDTMIIVNNDQTSGSISLIARGDIAEWTTFYLPGNLEESVDSVDVTGVSRKNIVVVFEIPEDLPNGEYLGNVAVSKKPENVEETEGSSVTVAQEIGRDVIINVGGEEELGLQVSVIPEEYIVGKNKPLNIRYIFDNLGNVSLKPQIDLKIKDLEGNSLYNAIYPYPEGERSVRPNAQYEIPVISVPTTGLEKGKYIVEMKFMHNGEVLFEKDFKFTIGSRGIVLGISDWKVNWLFIAIVGIVLVVALSLIFIKKKNTSGVL